ncbi:reverse transcriptase domain-containing protein [Tanacetum coccineum]
MMTVKYCPRDEIKKLEIKLWNLKMKGTNITSYTLHFQELALMCGCMFPEESDEVEKYVGGLPDMIRGNVMDTNNRTRGRTLGELTLLDLEKRGSTRDHCPCVPNATITTKGHVLPDVTNARRMAIWLVTAGVLGHFKRDCPNLKNKNMVIKVGMEMPQRKCMYADRSFVSTTFSSLIDITPTTLDHYYDVELADGKIIGINTIIRGCTLNFLDHPININLMPVELGSFDVIVGMDWLAKYHAVIDCAEKIVRVPWGNQSLIVHGDWDQT